LVTHDRWFSPGIPAFSTAKTDRHDIAEILLKVALTFYRSYDPYMGHKRFFHCHVEKVGT
jgi:hypothetical protein